MGNPRGVGGARAAAVEDVIASHIFEEEQDNRALRWGIAVAVLLHLGLLVVNLPKVAQDLSGEANKPKVYVVQAVRFKEPPPRPPQSLPEPRAVRIPIPDPTPDDPEPIRVEPTETYDVPLVDDLVIGIPESAPEPKQDGPLPVGGEVVAPVKLAAPQPAYTDLARKAHLQGPVVLQCVIDEQGRVTDVEVLKGMGMGLTESAVEAVRQWTYKPATLHGRPVAVYLSLTIQFRLQ